MKTSGFKGFVTTLIPFVFCNIALFSDEITAGVKPGFESSALDFNSLLNGTTDANDALNLEDSDFKLYWKEGIRFETSDGSFKMKMGGRIMNDWAFYSEDDDIEKEFGNLQDGTEFRRARLYFSGDIYKNAFFKAQYDFAGSDADFKDVYLGLKKIPVVGHAKVGHVKEPFSLEGLTSSKYITFMERSLPNAFAPGRNSGLSVYNNELDEKLTWAIGAFKEADDTGDEAEDGKVAVTGRITFLPWMEGKERLIHVGAAYSKRTDHSASTRIRQRPEAHDTPRFVDTGTFISDNVDLYGFEAAGVYGPLSLQGEYMQAKAKVPTGSDPTFKGYYIYGSYFITGEHRKYKGSAGAFSRVKPNKNFDGSGGLGALELALRYSNIDLDDDPILGGELDNYTAGLNWHWNPNVRIMFNYVNADLTDGGSTGTVDGKANLYLMRFQIDF